MTNIEPTDAQVIEASWETPRLFEAVFERHFDAVFRYLSARAGREAAPDLAADTFARAFQGRRRYRLERPSALPWLLGIATNLAREHSRSLRRAAAALRRLRARELPTPDFAEETAARTDAERRRVDLAAAFATLPAQERDVIALHFYGGLTQQEVAELLGIPVGTVKSRLAKAHTRLREHLRPDRPIHGLAEGAAPQEPAE